MSVVASADKNMAFSSEEEFGRLEAVSATDREKVCLLGFGFGVEENRFHKFDRAGMEAAGKISSSLRWGAKCAAGGQVQFITDSPILSICVKTGTKPDMFNMSPVAQCGADCYLLDNRTGEFVFYGVAKFAADKSEYTYTFFSDKPRTARTVLIDFPLYAEVKSFFIGIEKGADIRPYTAFKENGKLVFYGTSVLQGGCASRPGTAYTNIVSRRLKTECLNFGFSGNAFGEKIIAELLSEIEKPTAYILDYEANAIEKGTMESSLPVFISVLRKAHGNVPVLVVSGTKQSADFWNAEFCARREKMKIYERKTVERFRKEGDENIRFLDFGELFGKEFTEYTADGIHPTDGGFMLMAEAMTKTLKEML